MNREEIKAAIAVMQHFADGGEVLQTLGGCDSWIDSPAPVWNWGYCEYRIKPTPRTFYALDYNVESDRSLPGFIGAGSIGPLCGKPPLNTSVYPARVIKLVEVVE